MKDDQIRVMHRFIEQELAHSSEPSCCQLSMNEMKYVFDQAILTCEKLLGKEIDGEKFNEFLNFYRIIKTVEKVTEEMKSEKYLNAYKEGKIN